MTNNQEHDPLLDLIAAHAALFRGEEPQVSSHLPAGWYGIVDRLCTDLEQILDARVAQFSVAQIKQTFGSLRFYWDLDGEPSPLFADVMGSLPEDTALATLPTDPGTEVVVAATPVGTRITIRGTDALSRDRCPCHGRGSRVRANLSHLRPARTSVDGRVAPRRLRSP